MTHYIATATFKVCDEGRQQSNPTTLYDLHEVTSPTQTEIDVLSLLHEDGTTHFPAFHEASEPCVLQRPLGDLINIWHAEKIEGLTFCLHLYEGESRIEAAETKDSHQALRGEAESELDTLSLSPSPPDHLRDTIVFRLTFAFKNSSPVDHNLWLPSDVRVKLSTAMEALPLLIKEVVEETAAKDASLVATLIDNKHQLFIQPIIPFADERDFYTDFTRIVRIETVGDLFPSAPELTTSVPVRVKVKLRAVDDAPSDLNEAIVADTEIGYQFYRLGSLNKSAVSRTCEGGKVPIDIALVSWVENDGTVHLNKVYAWLINGLCLGECYTINEAEYDALSYAWTADYEDAENMEELCALIRAYRASGEADAKGSVPVAPTYSFRTFNPTEHGLGLDGWPKTGIYIAVKCVNMLRKHSGGSNIIFPTPENFQLEVESVDTAEAVSMLIEGELMEETHHDGRTSARLFQPVLYGKWRMEVWVLPQIDGETTMYRYTEGSLTQFLEPERGLEDGRLYVEAHFLPS